jgi:hypothetical protein
LPQSLYSCLGSMTDRTCVDAVRSFASSIGLLSLLFASAPFLVAIGLLGLSIACCIRPLVPNFLAFAGDRI